MSELRKWQTAWPVPADGSPLNSAHLRALALGTVATAAAGIGRLGWGLALPANGGMGSAATGAVNVPTLSGGKVHVKDLSVVLPEGVYVTLDTASAPLPDGGIGVLGLIYTLPAHANAPNRPAPVEPSLVCFADRDAATATGATVLAEICSPRRGKAGGLRWLVPALEIGAAPESAAAAAALGDAMLAAAAAAGANQRYEWQTVAAALRLAAAQPLETSSAFYNRDVARALSGVVALVRGASSAADNGALEAVAELAKAIDAAPGAASLPEALAAWDAALAAPFAQHGPLMVWLRGTSVKRHRLPGYPQANGIGGRLDRFDVAGAKRVELRLLLRDRVAPTVRVRVDEASFSTLVLATVPGGFAGMLSLPDKAQYLDLELPAEVEAELRETVGDGKYGHE
ncbi:hypothetical protein FHT77_005859 [Rhizobium sp. BK181]|uniref:hypothetical protein n=1 Tax=Rhizobium sp. BK181 TaxID=2587072 RepID=UPI0016194307|nr:hypothetical protein [Rhizobium sp. BK181]MBB3319941.1 hypothetical protein [Rhizobium sp. BK181]